MSPAGTRQGVTAAKRANVTDLDDIGKVDYIALLEKRVSPDQRIADLETAVAWTRQRKLPLSQRLRLT